MDDFNYIISRASTADRIGDINEYSIIIIPKSPRCLFSKLVI